MKKKLLLILMFMTMFIVGNKSANALECKVGEAGCTIDVIKNELGSENELACLYEVTLGYESYYSYIYLDRAASKNEKKDVFLVDSTYSINKWNDVELSLGGAYASKNVIFENSYNQLKNHVCPKNSTLLYWRGGQKGVNACFDNNGECSNHDGHYANPYNTTSKLIESESNLQKDMILLSDDYKSLCNKKIKNTCMYVSQSMTGNYVILNTQTHKSIFFDADDNQKHYFSSNISADVNEIWYQGIALKNRFNNNFNSCPNEIYLHHQNVTNYAYFSESKNSIEDYKLNDIYKFYNCNASGSEDDEEVIEDCSIFDDELLDTINGIMNIIRIAIPLLLIGLITYDFATAVFSSDDKSIPKVKSNAIKRIIIAVVIFFIPMLINLVFDIVNEVWGTKLETCGISENVDNYNQENN